MYTPEQVLRDGDRPSGRVLDNEGPTGAGIAEPLHACGAEVQIISRWSLLVPFQTIDESTVVICRIKERGIAHVSETWMKKIRDHEVMTFDMYSEQPRRIGEVDAIVLVTMRRANDALAAAPAGKVDQLFVIGDALASQSLGQASYEGRRFARLIGAPDASATFAGEYFRRDPVDV